MKATVLVRPKQGILDPQGQAVESSLRQLGPCRVARQRPKEAPELVGLHVSFRLHHDRQGKGGRAGPSLSPGLTTTR